MKIYIAFLCSFFSTILFAQDEKIRNIRNESERSINKDPNDTLQRTWRKGGIYGLNVSQGTLNNWAAGGDEFSLSLNSILNLFAFYKKDRQSWDISFDFNLGYVNTSSLGSRKNDDRFDLLSKYGYALNPKLNLAGIFNIRSQFFKGYIFPDNQKIYTSNFMAPGYLLLGLGLDYKATKNLSVFISPATARWVIVRDTALSNKGLYGVVPGEKSVFEFGAFATLNYLKEFNPTITYKGRLDLFSNYLDEPKNIDLFMSNVLNAKLGKIFSVSWSVDLIYDDDVKLFGDAGSSAALQLKSLVGLGLLLKF